MTDTRPAIELRGMSRRFDKRLAVDALDLTIERGEVFGLLGPNGSGKTTTMRVVATLLRPSGGSATVLGIDAEASPLAIRRQIGFMPERAGLYERLTIDTNVRLWAEAHGLPDPDASVKWALGFVEIADRASERVGSLSKGLRQRVALARAIVHRPALLLLDEPSSGLDPSAASMMESLIGELVAGGATVVMNTHRLAEADRLCTRVGVLRQRLLAVGTPSQLRRELLGQSLRVGVAGVPPAGLEAILAAAGCRDISIDARGFDCLVMDPDRDVPEVVARLVAAGGRVAEVRSGGDLERAYLHLIEQTTPRLERMAA